MFDHLQKLNKNISAPSTVDPRILLDVQFWIVRSLQLIVSQYIERLKSLKDTSFFHWKPYAILDKTLPSPPRRCGKFLCFPRFPSSIHDDSVWVAWGCGNKKPCAILMMLQYFKAAHWEPNKSSDSKILKNDEERIENHDSLVVNVVFRISLGRFSYG